MSLQLLVEVMKRVERARAVKSLLIFSVTTLDLSVMLGHIGANELILDTELLVNSKPLSL